MIADFGFIACVLLFSTLLACFHFLVCSGDGGNDVSMIQAAHCGVGIVGKVVMCSLV